MFRKIAFLCLPAFLTLLIWDSTFTTAHSNTSGSPGGYSGSPADGSKTCVNCHAGTPTTVNGLVVTNVPAEGYTPGTVYTITIFADVSNNTKYGFELAAVNANNMAIGGFIHTTSFTKTVLTKNATHTSSGTSAPNGARSWTLDWTAPVAGSGNVTFYLALNATNNNNSSSGDQIVKSTKVISEKVVPCVINDASVTAQQSTVCEGGSTNILVQNSEVGVSYQLKNVGTNANIGTAVAGNGTTISCTTLTLLSTTNFKVVATKAANCSLTLSSQPTVTVDEVATPTIIASGNTTFCEGDSVTLTASTAASYLWSNNATSQSIVVKTSGNYEVTTSNGGNCTKTSSATTVAVRSLPTPTITPQGSTEVCEGDSLVLMASSANAYLWSTGATNQQIVVYTAGNYAVTVEDQFGCKGTTTSPTVVNVHAPPPTDIFLTGNDTICFGDTTVLSAPSGYSYLWSTGASTENINVSLGGNYSVAVSSAFCTRFSDTIAVTVITVASPNFNYNTLVEICPNDTLELTLLENYFSYLWNDGTTAPTIVVTAAGDYSVLVGTPEGCIQKSDTVHFIAANSIHTTLQANHSLALCFGDSVSFSTSDVFDSYLWSNGSVSSGITVTDSGQYFVQVSRNSGCSGFSDTLTVSQLSKTNLNVIPAGLITGCDSLLVEANGSVVSYLWNNGNTNSAQFISLPGSYWITGVDTNNCSTQSDTVEIQLGKTPNPVISRIGNMLISSETIGNQWFFAGDSILGANDDSLFITDNGNYFVIVTDSTGLCSDTSNSILYDNTGINQHNVQRITFWPNPATKQLNIKLPTKTAVQLRLLDFTGKEIAFFNTENEQFIVDISNLAAGYYFLVVQTTQDSPTVQCFNVIKYD